MFLIVAAALAVLAALTTAAVIVSIRTERFAPLHAPSGVIARRRLCSPDAAAVIAAANGSAQDRLIAAAKTQSAAYPSVVPM
jgi:hypothetical protein